MSNDYSNSELQATVLAALLERINGKCSTATDSAFAMRRDRCQMDDETWKQTINHLLMAETELNRAMRLLDGPFEDPDMN